MSFAERVSLEWREAARTVRLLADLPKFLSGGSWSAARMLEKTARDFPDHTGIAYLDQRFPWRRVNALANQYASYFAARGIGPGDVVALMMDNRPDFLFIEMGLAKIRAVAALINTNLSGTPLAHAVNVARPKLFVVGSEHCETVRSMSAELEIEAAGSGIVVQLEPDVTVAGFEVINDDVEAAAQQAPPAAHLTSDPVTYIYTSGTTGLPKAARITNQRFLMAGAAFGRIIHEARAGDVIYVALPLYHSSAQWIGWASCVRTGATLALRRKFSATQFWKDVSEFGATHFVYIGELCRYLLNQPLREGERNHQIRVAVGNGLRPDIWQKFQERFGIPVIREFYGATEGNAPMVNVDGRPGMVGRLRPGQIIVKCDQATGEIVRGEKGRCTKVRVGETGLLLGRISAVTKFDGYVDESATQKKIVTDVLARGDQYFNSGDLLTLHEHNWVAFADRIGDTFRWKGENVSTNEVAETLNGAKGVLETNVYGVTVPGNDGRAGMASVNVNDAFDVEAFGKFVVEKLPRYMAPYFLRVQRDMRTTGTFKHQKVDYREEGYDPAKVTDPLYFLDGERYVELDAALFARLDSGEMVLK